MTTPPGGAGDDNREGPEENPNYPSYPSTPHPEDTPGFGQSQDNPYANPYGQQPGGYGYPNPGEFSAGYAGYSAYPGYSGEAGTLGGAAPAEQGTGKIDVMRAVGWGFTSIFKNAKVWILGALVYVVVVGLIPALLSGTNPESTFAGVVSLVASIVAIVVGILVLRGALHQVDKRDMTWRDFTQDVNFWPTLLLQILLGILSSLVAFLIARPSLVQMSEIVALAGAAQDSQTAVNITEEQVLNAVGAVMGALGLVILIWILLEAFVMFMPWYLVEPREGFGGAISQGFRAGARNYFRLVAFNLVAALVLVIGITLTFGVLSVILLPAYVLILAHMYRQAAGGAIPAR